ncbi:MAG: AraC family transcriptional regulator [Paracoccus sp. (in: a-proteobacteria)]|nr:AraC family transcriptional regulator [Paracoccus sp. (in: a-proteobacteria)]
MAVPGNADWSKGFPFSVSRLRMDHGDPSCRLRKAAVTSQIIPDCDNGAADFPDGPLRNSMGQPEWGNVARENCITPDDCAVTATAAPRTAPDTWRTDKADDLRPMVLPRRIAPRASALRLLPIAAFLWGSTGHSPAPRTRPEHAVIWVQSGLHRLRFPRHDLALHDGALWFIPAGTAFASLPHPHTSGHVLLIPTDLARRAVPAFPDIAHGGFAGDGAQAVALNMRELADETRHEDHMALDCHLGLLATRLARVAAASPPMRANRTTLPCHSAVARFIDAARRNLDATVTLAERAEALGMTLAALDRACLAFRGKHALEVLNELRIERAASLLRGTTLPVAQIALASGHVSLAHFTRAFVAATGRTPQTFRDQIRITPDGQLHL